jgi:hypothetical protein
MLLLLLLFTMWLASDAQSSMSGQLCSARIEMTRMSDYELQLICQLHPAGTAS